MKSIFILFSFILILSCNSFAKKGEMIFSSAVEVSPRESISLYDIVESKNVSEEELSKLKQIEVANKETKFISKIDLILKLRGIDANFLIPNEIKILRSGQNVSRMELERKIKNKLLASCLNCDFQIQINSVPQHLMSDWLIDLNIDLSRSAVLIPVFSASQIENKGYITVEIKKYVPSVVLIKSVKLDEIITADMVRIEKRKVQNYTEILTDLKKAIGMQARKFLIEGQALAHRDLKKEVVVKKGHLVRAQFGKGQFDISVSAVVEESGSVGDIIKVKNIDTHKILSALVVDRGLVQID